MMNMKLLAPRMVSRKAQFNEVNFKVSIDLKRSAGRATLPTKEDRPEGRIGKFIVRLTQKKNGQKK